MAITACSILFHPSTATCASRLPTSNSLDMLSFLFLLLDKVLPAWLTSMKNSARHDVKKIIVINKTHFLRKDSANATFTPICAEKSTPLHLTNLAPLKDDFNALFTTYISIDIRIRNLSDLYLSLPEHMRDTIAAQFFDLLDGRAHIASSLMDIDLELNADRVWPKPRERDDFGQKDHCTHDDEKHLDMLRVALCGNEKDVKELKGRYFQVESVIVGLKREKEERRGSRRCSVVVSTI